MKVTKCRVLGTKLPKIFFKQKLENIKVTKCRVLGTKLSKTFSKQKIEKN